MTKPFVLGVDLDGVCADYFEGFRSYVAKMEHGQFRVVPTEYDFSKCPVWSDLLPDRESFLEWHKNAVLDGLFEWSTPIQGASEALWKLSDAGIYIRIITHRLHNKGDYGRAASDTVTWLDRNNIPYRSLAFERYKSDVSADLYIDDSPDNITDLRSSGKRAIVFDAPYNQKVVGERVFSWSELVPIVLEAAHGCV